MFNSALTVCRLIVVIRLLYIRLSVRYKYYKKHSCFGLAWSRPCADRGLSRPTSVFHTTQ